MTAAWSCGSGASRSLSSYYELHARDPGNGSEPRAETRSAVQRIRQPGVPHVSQPPAEALDVEDLEHGVSRTRGVRSTRQTVLMPYEQTLAAFRRGENDEAARLAARDVAAAREAGDVQACVDGLCMMARVALREGKLEEVAGCAEEAEQLARAGEDLRWRRMPIHLRAVAARMAGRYDEGRELYRQSIALNDALGEAAMAAAEHRNLAYLEIRAGNQDQARELFAESVRRLRNVEAPTLAAYLVFDEATIAALDGDYETASARLAAAEALWDEQGVVPDPDDAAELAELRRQLTDAGVRLTR